jgi:putative ubiquitin-RnfH superfamily antitoxin RatB of RatAB toxin-antitoxin module
LTCWYCKQKRHIAINIGKLKNKKVNNEVKQTGLTTLKSGPQSCDNKNSVFTKVNEPTEKVLKSESVIEIYEPFMSGGFVAL